MKQITIIITLVFVFHLSNSFGQGGGKLLVFDGTNNNVELKSTFQNQDGTKSFSFCAWIKSTNVGKAGQRVLCDDENNTKGYALSLGDPGSGLLRFYVRGLSTVSLDVPSGANQLSNNIWYHVAAVYGSKF